MKVLVVSSDSAENALFTEDIFVRVVSGVGKENALANTILNCTEDVDLILNVGTCGAKKGSADIFDVVCVKRVINRDADLTQFHLPQYTTLDSKRGTMGPINISDEGLTIASSDSFASTVIEEAELYDMEAYGVALAAKCLKKDLIIIKGVSDIIGESLKIKDYRKLLKELAVKIHERALSEVLRRSES